MNGEIARIAASIHLGTLYLSEQLFELADATDDPRQKRHLLAAAKALNGIDEKRDLESYLGALSWTLEQVSIEIEDVLGEAGEGG